MGQYRKGFNAGYSEGYMIGRLEEELRVVKRLVERGYAQNYEDAMRAFEIEEDARARLMDYLHFDSPETWGPLSDEGWPEREERMREIMEEKRREQEKSQH